MSRVISGVVISLGKPVRLRKFLMSPPCGWHTWPPVPKIFQTRGKEQSLRCSIAFCKDPSVMGARDGSWSSITTYSSSSSARKSDWVRR
eukprot:2064686-Pleurochrysis_carterae.AAC.3